MNDALPQGAHAPVGMAEEAGKMAMLSLASRTTCIETDLQMTLILQKTN